MFEYFYNNYFKNILSQQKQQYDYWEWCSPAALMDEPPLIREGGGLH